MIVRAVDDKNRGVSLFHNVHVGKYIKPKKQRNLTSMRLIVTKLTYDLIYLFEHSSDFSMFTYQLVSCTSLRTRRPDARPLWMTVEIEHG